MRTNSFALIPSMMILSPCLRKTQIALGLKKLLHAGTSMLIFLCNSPTHGPTWSSSWPPVKAKEERRHIYLKLERLLLVELQHSYMTAYACQPTAVSTTPSLLTGTTPRSFSPRGITAFDTFSPRAVSSGSTTLSSSPKTISSCYRWRIRMVIPHWRQSIGTTQNVGNGITTVVIPIAKKRKMAVAVVSRSDDGWETESKSWYHWPQASIHQRRPS